MCAAPLAAPLAPTDRALLLPCGAAVLGLLAGAHAAVPQLLLLLLLLPRGWHAKGRAGQGMMWRSQARGKLAGRERGSGSGVLTVGTWAIAGTAVTAVGAAAAAAAAAVAALSAWGAGHDGAGWGVISECGHTCGLGAGASGSKAEGGHRRTMPRGGGNGWVHGPAGRPTASGMWYSQQGEEVACADARRSGAVESTGSSSTPNSASA